ncbi:MAG: Rieske (2Fe-2S) protein [Deltaproteobacteria bacterium]|nr:Rieske (2Fe-2S) protein [Deltaproteobacteria bacterium]
MTHPRLAVLPSEAHPKAPADYRYPFSPFPTGWYQLGPSADVRPGQVVSKTFAGDEVVVWRTESGEARISGAHCPHMGAHFGHGGKVQGEELWCPFHGFCFDGEGSCTKTGYDTKPPKTARLRIIPSLERHGFVFGWHDDLGRAPRFTIPETDDAGWTGFRHHAFNLRGHPQETTENSVDTGHLAVVHGYTGIETLERLKLDGDHLTVRYAMHRKLDFLGQPDKIIRTEFTIHVYGLGYSRVEAHVPELNLRSRHLVLSSPIDGDRIDLTIAVAMGETSPRDVHRLLSWVPKALFRPAAHLGMFKAYVHDVSQDLAIWENKSYVHPAQVAQGDGPIGRYRTWARRFYPDTEPKKKATPAEPGAGAASA